MFFYEFEIFQYTEPIIKYSQCLMASLLQDWSKLEVFCSWVFQYSGFRSKNSQDQVSVRGWSVTGVESTECRSPEHSYHTLRTPSIVYLGKFSLTVINTKMIVMSVTLSKTFQECLNTSISPDQLFTSRTYNEDWMQRLRPSPVHSHESCSVEPKCLTSRV